MLKCLKSQFTKHKARCNHTTITRQYALLCRSQETYSGAARQAVNGFTPPSKQVCCGGKVRVDAAASDAAR